MIQKDNESIRTTVHNVAKQILRESEPALCLHEVTAVAFESFTILLSAAFASILITLWDAQYYGATMVAVVVSAFFILALAVFAPIRSHAVMTFWVLWWLSVLLQLLPALHSVDGMAHPPVWHWLISSTRIGALVVLVILVGIDTQIRDLASGWRLALMMFVSSVCFVILAPWNFMFDTTSTQSPIGFFYFHVLCRVGLSCIINIRERSSGVLSWYELRLHALIQLQAVLSVPNLWPLVFVISCLIFLYSPRNVRISFFLVACQDIVLRRCGYPTSSRDVESDGDHSMAIR